MHGNPQTIWPELVTAAEELLYNDENEVLALQVENRINNKRGIFDLFVRKQEVNDTLSKAMAWAKDEEEYELCTRIKNLEDFLAKQIMF